MFKRIHSSVKMSTVRTIHSIDTFKKLIDLNGDTVNFDINFKVVSQNKEPFDILVIDQTSLDNSPNLEYKKAQGEISGNIVNNKNVYQNYYLILKADQPCQCEVEITKKELPKTPIPTPVRTQNPPSLAKPSGHNWIKTILICAAIAGISLAMYWILYKKRNVEGLQDVLPSKFYSPPKSPTPKLAFSPKNTVAENPLLERLKKLKVK